MTAYKHVNTINNNLSELLKTQLPNKRKMSGSIASSHDISKLGFINNF